MESGIDTTDKWRATNILFGPRVGGPAAHAVSVRGDCGDPLRNPNHGHAAEQLPQPHHRDLPVPVPAQILLSTVQRKPSAGAVGQDNADHGRSGVGPHNQSPRRLAPALRHVAPRRRAAHHWQRPRHGAPRLPSRTPNGLYQGNYHITILLRTDSKTQCKYHAIDIPQNLHKKLTSEGPHSNKETVPTVEKTNWIRFKIRPNLDERGNQLKATQNFEANFQPLQIQASTRKLAMLNE